MGKKHKTQKTRGLWVILLTCACAGAPASAAQKDGFVMNLDTMHTPVSVSVQRAEQANRMGAWHFNIPVLLCQKNRFSNVQEWCGADYPATVRELVRELTARNYSVGLFPFLLAKDGSWRGHFDPTDFELWSRHYLERLSELAQWTQGLEVADFIVGSELSILYKKSDSFWRHALGTVRKLTGAQTFVVANWDAVEDVRFWDASDVIATSSYFPLVQTATDSTRVAALTQAWKPWKEKLLKLSQKTGKPLYFAELGYSSRSEAARRPWAYDPPAQLDLDLQSRLFLAFEQAWAHEPKLTRMTVWAMEDLAAPLLDTGFAVQGKPAEQILAHTFRMRRKNAPPLARSIPVALTMDDIPMWFVTAPELRIAAYQSYLQTFRRHAVPAIAFVNPGFIHDTDTDHRERDALRQWQKLGITLGNHTAHHTAASAENKAQFLADLAEGATLMSQLLPGWDTRAKLFRFPNLQEMYTQEIAAEGYQILGTTFDSRDWSWSERFHFASPSERLDIRGQAFQIIGDQFERAIQQRSFADITTERPLTFMIHSTLFTQTHLEEILSFLEARGARWAAIP